jgi:cysteine synthase A
MLPDTGERYLSTPLFDDVSADMNDEEIALSRSTPGCRFEVTPAPSSAPEPESTSAAANNSAYAAGDAAAPAVDPESDAEIEALLADPAQPVVMFALEWCEFCWSVRKAFAAYRIDFRSVDLDVVAYQKDNRGGRIREALRARTGFTTLPQIFVGGEFVGGATDVFDRLKAGELATLLRRHGVTFDETVRADPYDFLPKWLHPRRVA